MKTYPIFRERIGRHAGLKAGLAAFTFLLTGAVTSSAQSSCAVTHSLNVSTGYDYVTGTVLPAGAVDPEWKITDLTMDCLAKCPTCIMPGPGVSNDAVTVFPDPSYKWVTGPNSQWLCFNTSSGKPSYGTMPGGDYGMTLTRTFRVCTEGDFLFNLKVASDNYISNISVDAPSSSIFFQPPSDAPGNYMGFVPVSSVVHLTAGTHTLNVTVKNYDLPAPDPDNHHGINIWGTISAASGISSLVVPDAPATCGCIDCTGNTVDLHMVQYVGGASSDSCFFVFNPVLTTAVGWKPHHYIVTDGSDVSPVVYDTLTYPDPDEPLPPLGPVGFVHGMAFPAGQNRNVQVEVFFVNKLGDTCTAVDTLNVYCGRFGAPATLSGRLHAGDRGIPGVAATFRIYPNPAKDLISLEAGSEPVELVEVYDLTGRKLVARHYDALQVAELSVEKLPAGMYILKINKHVPQVIVKTE